MTYALIELNSGFVWWTGEAMGPEVACRTADYEIGAEDREYHRITESEARTTAGGLSLTGRIATR